MSDKYLPEKFSIKPVNNKHSKAIQKRLFDLGYEWCASGKKICNYNLKNIDVRNGQMIEGQFLYYERVLTLDDLYRLERKPEFKPVYGNGWRIEEEYILVGGGDLPEEEAVELAKNILEAYGVER